jgi:hypothetical protein
MKITNLARRTANLPDDGNSGDGCARYGSKRVRRIGRLLGQAIWSRDNLYDGLPAHQVASSDPPPVRFLLVRPS